MARVTLVGLEGRVKTIESDTVPLVKEHDKYLVRGNGDPSILERLRRIEDYIEIEVESKRFITRLFITIMVSNVAMLVISAIVWILKIAPALEMLAKQAG